MKTAVVVLVKNEEANIEEWMAHHLNLGFDTLVVLDNLSSDRTVELVRRAGLHADVRVYAWPWKYDRMQVDAFFTACGFLKEEFDWVAFLDGDEFLMPDPDTSVLDILHAQHGASAIVLNWAMFGSNGHDTDPENGLLGGFLTRAEDNFGPNTHTKMLVRPGRVRACLNPHYFVVEGRTVTPSGEAVLWSPQEGLTQTVDLRGLRVNHYFTRSKASWARRISRGFVTSQRTWQDFEDYDRNEVRDTSALPFSVAALARAAQFATPPISQTQGPVSTRSPRARTRNPRAT